MSGIAKRVAIVTGSSRGIGEAIVRRLASENYAVAVNDISANASGIDSLVSELNDKHGPKSALGVVADVTSQSEVKDMISRTTAGLGPLTTMIANAGIAHISPAIDTDESTVRRILDVNVMGVWNCYQAAAQQMISQGPVSPDSPTGYKILGCASIVAFKPFPLLAHYSASKWAVRGLTQVMAMELAKHKISVNAYAPGIVGTAMWDQIDEKLGELEGRKRGETIDHYVNGLTAMGRVSTTDDVAKVVGGFLAGGDSEFVTGQTIVVDGGIIYT